MVAPRLSRAGWYEPQEETCNCSKSGQQRDVCGKPRGSRWTQAPRSSELSPVVKSANHLQLNDPLGTLANAQDSLLINVADASHSTLSEVL